MNFASILDSKAQRLSLCTDKLKVLNPLNIMEKGFSVVYKDEKIIKSTNELHEGDVIKIDFYDGSKKAQIIKD